MVTIVMGPTCSGKSTYIKEHFPNTKVIDLMDFQDYQFVTVDSVWQSYEDCAKALQEAVKTGEDVVLEHTLLKETRRTWYIKKIREVSDCDINIVCLAPSAYVISNNSKKRKLDFSEEYAQEMLDFMETPDISEGYKKVEVISDAR